MDAAAAGTGCLFPGPLSGDDKWEHSARPRTAGELPQLGFQQLLAVPSKLQQEAPDLSHEWHDTGCSLSLGQQMREV